VLSLPVGGISAHNRGYLEALHRAGGPLTVRDAAGLLDLDEAEARRLLGYLTRRGWLARVRRGLYIPVPLESRRSGEWVEDLWVVAAKTFAPGYLGGWTACEHWDLTEQIFNDVMVVTARPIRSRKMVIQGTRLRLKTRPEEMLFGTRKVWRGQVPVLLSDPSRTIIDILDDPSIGGGIRHVADAVHEYLISEHRNDALLVGYGDRLGNRTVFKRLGFILETTGVDAAELLADCRTRRSAGITALDPSSSSRGRIVRRWNLRANVDLRDVGSTL